MLTKLKVYFIYTTLITIIFLFLGSATSSADLLNFKDLHNQYVTMYANDIKNESLSGNSATYYYTSYYLHGMLSAVEATNDETMLRNVMQYIDNMLSKAIVNRAGNKVWGPLGPPLATDDAPVQLYSYKACGPIARAAAVIMRNPTFKAKYASDATRYINFVDDSIIQYWHIKTYGTLIPYLPADLGGWGTPLEWWVDKNSMLGEIAASLYVATRNAPTARTPMYLDIATRVAQGFKRKLQPAGAGWIWDKGTYMIDAENPEGVPDTAHTTDEVRLLVSAYEAGVVFSLADVQRLASTLSDTIWNGSTNDPLFSNYINGSNNRYRTRTEAGFNGIIYPGWAFLGKYSSKAQTATSSLLNAIVAGTQNPSVLVNATNYGKVALSGHLLRNGTSSTVPVITIPSAPRNLLVSK